jgi:putative transposase
MPRRARFTIENGTYHVMVRGNNRDNIFHDDSDYRKYLELIKENKEKYKLKIYHYVLMDNHAHMIIRSPEGKSLSAVMKKIAITYTRYYRKKYGGIGHFFQDRFKSFLIQEGIYLLECGRYVELNPVRAGKIRYPQEYKWSSYRAYVADYLDEIVDLSPEYKELSEKKEKRRRIYREYVEQGEIEKREEERFFKEGVYGSQEFKEQLRSEGLKHVWSHSGRPKKDKSI